MENTRITDLNVLPLQSLVVLSIFLSDIVELDVRPLPLLEVVFYDEYT